MDGGRRAGWEGATRNEEEEKGTSQLSEPVRLPRALVAALGARGAAGGGGGPAPPAERSASAAPARQSAPAPPPAVPLAASWCGRSGIAR
jgi:hypothetical protein